MSAPPLLIGLTGGIGSGKSTVAKLFAQHGARIIDTDVISHALTHSGGAAIAAIRAAFGDEYIDAHGALDRAKMRALVFSDPAQKQRLQNILHPLIREQSWRKSATASPAPYTLLVVPLLFESTGYRPGLGRTLVVDCPEELQIARTMQRSGLDRAAVESIMAQQIDRKQRLALADDIISNEGQAGDLDEQVARLHSKYLTIAARSD